MRSGNRLCLVPLVVGIVVASIARPALAAPPTGNRPRTITGTLLFSSYGECRRGANGKEANVYSASFRYTVGSKFTIAKPDGIACTKDSVDGLVFAPDGDLLVAGKADGVFKMNPRTGVFTTFKMPVDAYHLMLDPTGTLWASGLPGQPASPVLGPGQKGVAHPLAGDDTTVTTIAWDSAGKAYYTSSGYAGGGSFGRIDLATFTTKRLLPNVPAAHGMVFDRYTGHFILMGGNHVTQVAVEAAGARIVSDLAAGMANLDQGTVDSNGHLFAACNCGSLLFVDYSATRAIGDAGNFRATQPTVDSMDDVAPLAGPGANVARVIEDQAGTRILMDEAVLFDFDRYDLKPSAEAALAESKASIIDKQPGARLLIEGHTDDRGKPEYNLKLSTERAQSVAAWLEAHGILAGLLETKGYGKTRPRYPNTTHENRARNRRVEIVITN